MNKIILAAIRTMIAKTLAAKAGQGRRCSTPGRKAFFDKIDNLKFLGYVDADGYPVIIPLIQAQSARPRAPDLLVWRVRRRAGGRSRRSPRWRCSAWR